MAGGLMKERQFDNRRPRSKVLPMRGWWLLISMVVGLAGCERKQVLPPPKAIAVREDGVIALKLATYNVRYEDPSLVGPRNWKDRSIGVVRTVMRISPDVFAVQEAMHGQVADMRASLPGYDFIGVGRDDGGRAGEYSGFFYQRDRFVLDANEQGTFWLSDTPAVPGSKSWGNTIPRSVTWARLTDRATSRSFYVYAAHFDHRNQVSRERGAAALAQRIDQRHHRDEPVVLMGDFNATRQNPSVAYLEGKAATLNGKQGVWKDGLQNAFHARHPESGNRTTLHLYRGDGRGYHVDHILVSRTAKVVDATIVVTGEPFPSDHFPVVATVEFSSD
jgi:endonuclease/exonuclease/phosphatase family metal-dependent hydrolase